MDAVEYALRVNPENPPTWVLFAPIDDTAAVECLILAREIRSWGIPTQVDGRPNRLKKKLQRAVEMKCFYAIIVGPADIAQGSVQVKDLDENAQESVRIHSAHDGSASGLGRWLAERLLGAQDLRAEILRRARAGEDQP